MRREVFVLTTIVLLITLVIRVFLYFSETSITEGDKVEHVTRILSQVKTSSRYQSFSVSLKGQRFFINTSLYPEVSYGEKIKISGIAQKRELERGEIWILEDPKIEINEEFSILQPIYVFREKVIKVFKSYLPSDEASLLLGIVFGIKESFSKDFSDNLRTAGVLHVIAASGMNVSMFGGLLAGFFSVFLRRQLAVLLTILGILIYTVLAGLEASIVRAAIMGILAFTAQILGRQSWAFLGLIFAGFLMIFISPALIFDIGFQLSFSATLGLIYLSPVIEKILRFGRRPIVRLIAEDANTTISAQAATLPIILGNFGSYSVLSILANVFVLWTIPLLMIIGGILSILVFIYEGFGIILYISLPLLWYFKKVVTFFGELGGQFGIESFPWQFGAAYYLFLLAIIVKSRK